MLYVPQYELPHKDRDEDLSTALGFITESQDFNACSAAAGALGDSALNGVSVYLFEGEVVTGVAFHISVAGSGTQTAAFSALYNSDYELVAESATEPTMGDETGPKNFAFDEPYTVTASGLYYLALLFVGGTTPQLVRGAFSAEPVTWGWRQTGQATLPATATPIAPSVTCVWMAAY